MSLHLPPPGYSEVQISTRRASTDEEAFSNLDSVHDLESNFSTAKDDLASNAKIRDQDAQQRKVGPLEYLAHALGAILLALSLGMVIEKYQSRICADQHSVFCMAYVFTWLLHYAALGLD